MPYIQGGRSVSIPVFSGLRCTVLEYEKLMTFVIGRPQDRHKLNTCRGRSLERLGQIAVNP